MLTVFLVVFVAIIAAILVIDVMTDFRFGWLNDLAAWSSVIITFGLVIFLIIVVIQESLGLL